MGNMARTPLVDSSTTTPASNTQTTPTTSVPTSGQTVQVADGPDDVLLVLNPAGLLAVLTVALPTEAKSRLGQQVRIVSLKAITLFSITGATTIINAPASLLLGAAVTLQKVAANTWVKL